MRSSILFFLTALTLPLPQVWGVHPNIFVPVSNATCQPEYAWMNNAEQKSPCLTVAYVIAACVGDTWTQPALPSGYSYNSPNGTTATPCYCSWSCYNLMMACTLCQNPAYTSDITTWPSFSQNCPSNYKSQMFPQGYVLAGNVSIPYWATTNPETWSSELFNIQQAQTFANQSQSDYWPSSSSSSSNSGSSGNNSNIGAIIGGAVGGAAGCLLLILVGGYLLYRRRHRRPHTGGTPILHTGAPMTQTHTRWPSDPSAFTYPTPTSSPPPMSQTSLPPQGINSLSPTVFSSFPATETASFLTTGNPSLQRSQPIPMI